MIKSLKSNMFLTCSDFWMILNPFLVIGEVLEVVHLLSSSMDGSENMCFNSFILLMITLLKCIEFKNSVSYFFIKLVSDFESFLLPKINGT